MTKTDQPQPFQMTEAQWQAMQGKMLAMEAILTRLLLTWADMTDDPQAAARDVLDDAREFARSPIADQFPPATKDALRQQIERVTENVRQMQEIWALHAAEPSGAMT